jgi:hypothetical protein
VSIKKELQKLRAEKRKRLAEWSHSVRERDGWRCAYCGQPNRRLNAHHLLSKELYPQFMFDTKIGISLCPFKCHRRKAHFDGVAFTIWLMEHRPDQFKYIKKLLEEGNTSEHLQKEERET